MRPPFMAAASAITPLPSTAGLPAWLPSPESVSCIAAVAVCPFARLALSALLQGSHDTLRNGKRPPPLHVFHQLGSIDRRAPCPPGQFRYTLPDRQIQSFDKRGVNPPAQPLFFQHPSIFLLLSHQHMPLHLHRIPPPLMLDYLGVKQFYLQNPHQLLSTLVCPSPKMRCQAVIVVFEIVRALNARTASCFLMRLIKALVSPKNPVRQWLNQ
jgi:hypothetical protein